MFLTVVTAMALLSTLAAADEGWELKAESKGVKVMARTKPGSDVRELKSIGEFDAPPQAVFRALTDFAAYRDTMPYTEVSNLLSTEEADGKVRGWLFYTVVNVPMVSRRDYTIQVRDESDWKDGKGFLKTSWTVSDKGPAPKDGVVRVKVNDGSWLLEPIDGGKRTRGTYYLFTDPGGSLPSWIANKANSSGIPDVFEAVRKTAKKQLAAK